MEKRASRGRPRSFDKQAKLGAITQSFWENGFDGTSLDDLSAATGLSRPSLYAAYGDKESMFLLSLHAFAERMKAVALSAEQDSGGAQASLLLFYEGALDLYFSQSRRSLGCLVFSTAIGNCGNNANVRKAVDQYFRQMDKALAKLLRGQVPHLSTEEAGLLAKLASGLLVNLAIRARAGANRNTLRRMAVDSARLVANATGRIS